MVEKSGVEETGFEESGVEAWGSTVDVLTLSFKVGVTMEVYPTRRLQDISTPSFNPGLFKPRLFNHQLINLGLFNPRLFNHELFNPRFLNLGLFNPKSGVEKFRVEKSRVEMSFNLKNDTMITKIYENRKLGLSGLTQNL